MTKQHPVSMPELF